MSEVSCAERLGAGRYIWRNRPNGYVALRVKDSFDPFVALLDEHEVVYRVREARPGVIMAGGEVVEIIRAIGDAAQNPPMWAALAFVIVAFIKRVRSRKVIITTNDDRVIQAEGRSVRELEKILENAKNVIAFDPKIPKVSQTHSLTHGMKKHSLRSNH